MRAAGAGGGREATHRDGEGGGFGTACYRRRCFLSWVIHPRVLLSSRVAMAPPPGRCSPAFRGFGWCCVQPPVLVAKLIERVSYDLCREVFNSCRCVCCGDDGGDMLLPSCWRKEGGDC